MRRWALALVVSFLVGQGGLVFLPRVEASGGDLFEVAAVAQQAEGSTRTWGYRTFIVLAIVAAIIAAVTHHAGVFMAVMVLIFLAVFIGRGVDRLTETAGLAEGATLTAEQRLPVMPTPPAFIEED